MILSFFSADQGFGYSVRSTNGPPAGPAANAGGGSFRQAPAADPAHRDSFRQASAPGAPPAQPGGYVVRHCFGPLISTHMHLFLSVRLSLDNNS